MAKECAFGGECREIIEASEKIRTLEADNANHYAWRKDVTAKLDDIKESVNGLKGRIYALFIGAGVLAWAYSQWFAGR